MNTSVSLPTEQNRTKDTRTEAKHPLFVGINEVSAGNQRSAATRWTNRNVFLVQMNKSAVGLYLNGSVGLYEFE